MAKLILEVICYFSGIALLSWGLIQDNWVGVLGLALVLVSCAFLARRLANSEVNNARH